MFRQRKMRRESPRNKAHDAAAKERREISAQWHWAIPSVHWRVLHKRSRSSSIVLSRESRSPACELRRQLVMGSMEVRSYFDTQQPRLMTTASTAREVSPSVNADNGGNETHAAGISTSGWTEPFPFSEEGKRRDCGFFLEVSSSGRRCSTGMCRTVLTEYDLQKDWSLGLGTCGLSGSNV